MLSRSSKSLIGLVVIPRLVWNMVLNCSWSQLCCIAAVAMLGQSVLNIYDMGVVAFVIGILSLIE